jgi:hypothetical protein
MTQAEAAGPRWIIEGVYGWLAEVALPRATSLIWLDLPWEDCRAGLLQRGPWPGVDEAGFAEFLSWAEAYTSRRTSTSRAGHGRFFEAFAGPKTRLDSREGIGRLMAGLAEEKAE